MILKSIKRALARCKREEDVAARKLPTEKLQHKEISNTKGKKLLSSAEDVEFFLALC